MSVCRMDDSPWCSTGTCRECDAAREPAKIEAYIPGPYRGTVIPAFKPGDVVALKSGGPNMTVVSVGGQVTCIWFDEVDQRFDTNSDMYYFSWRGPIRETFPPEALELEDKDEE